jgi:hypothetical protein
VEIIATEDRFDQANGLSFSVFRARHAHDFDDLHF